MYETCSLKCEIVIKPWKLHRDKLKNSIIINQISKVKRKKNKLKK